jgi:hypothetical protein
MCDLLVYGVWSVCDEVLHIAQVNDQHVCEPVTAVRIPFEEILQRDREKKGKLIM